MDFFSVALGWAAIFAIVIALLSGISGARLGRMAVRREPSRASGVLTFFSSISWIVMIMALSVVSVALFWLFVLLCAHLRGNPTT